MKEKFLTVIASCRTEGETREDVLRLLKLSILFTFVLGLAAHAYIFFADCFSHDALNALYSDGVENYWKMQLGRFFLVAYRRLTRGELTLPWLIGLLSLLWISLAVFLTARLFRLRSPVQVALTAGILTVNLTVIAAVATFIYEFDGNMFAMLLAVAAAFAWARFGLWGAAAGAVLIAGSLGIYQSYICVTVTLIMLLCMRELAGGESFKSIMNKGLRAVAMLVVGGLIYFVLMKLLFAVKHIDAPEGEYNSVTNALKIFTAGDLPERFTGVFRDWASAFFAPSVSHIGRGTLVVNCLLAVLAAVIVLRRLFSHGMGIKEKLLYALLCLLLPFGMNATYFFFGGAVHDLMKYAFWLAYFAVLLGAWGESGKLRWLPAAAAVLAALLLWQNIVLANTLYVKKDLEQEATLSAMTRIVYRMEENPEYVPGETPVCFAGVPDQLAKSIYGFEEYADICGAETVSAVPFSRARYNFNAYAAYFKYVLANPAVMCETEKWQELQESPEVRSMPVYPAEGCMKLIDGVFVVRAGTVID